ncbi:MAG: ABC transporter substrate-binding protein [Candidatus Atribacteria bacterium]|nr:ABC transporter substrate-binding protein [Candidatus Atribacteria bacterium]
MLRKRCLLILVILFVFSLMLTGYAEDIIKIGAVGPLTGESSSAGLDELKGKQMAISDINAKGGVLGKDIQLFFEDDASQPAQTASAAMKLIYQNGVVAIIGAHNSACTLAVMEIIDKNKIPMVTPGSSSPKVTAIGNKWITRAFPSDAIQAKALVNYTLDTIGAKRIGIIYINDDFGVGGYNAVKKSLEERGENLAGAELFMGEDKDMSSPLTKLKANNLDALFIWCQFLPGSLIMRQAREMGWDIPFYTSTGCVHPTIFELAGDAFEGTIQTVPFIPNVPDPEIQEWVKRYEDKFGQEPSQNSARAYDATMILLNAIEKAGSTEPEALRDAIRHTKDFQGIQGKITIDPDTGEYIGEVMIVKAEKGDWTFINKVSTE